MAKPFRTIGDSHRDFILHQRIFFVASAASESHTNVSPRSTDSLRLLDSATAAYLDRTGSGNETAAHIRAGGLVTFMFCAFERLPLILRLYGRGSVLHRSSPAYRQLLARHFGGTAPLGTRQIISLDVQLVQTSCGFGIPLFDYRGERDTLDKWTAGKVDAGIKAYWREKNLTSIDGLPTGLLEGEETGWAPRSTND